jgi:hypothetical protein
MSLIGKVFRNLKSLLFLPREVIELKKLTYSLIELNQKLALEVYKKSAPALDDKGFRVNSQFEEDGLLLFIFGKIGFGNRIGVEFCCGNGRECILANFILYHHFYGLLIDGDADNIESAKRFFTSHPNTILQQPRILQHWITKNNVNEILSANGFTGEIDLLSIDVDGVQYYLMQELRAVSARVIVFESSNAFPKDLSITVPYKDDFNAHDGKANPEFRSVSHRATVKLMRSKGYRLVGANYYGFNLIFLRNDIAPDVFPEIDYLKCFENIHSENRQKIWPQISHLPWVKV